MKYNHCHHHDGDFFIRIYRRSKQRRKTVFTESKLPTPPVKRPGTATPVPVHPSEPPPPSDPDKDAKKSQPTESVPDALQGMIL